MPQAKRRVDEALAKDPELDSVAPKPDDYGMIDAAGSERHLRKVWNSIHRILLLTQPRPCSTYANQLTAPRKSSITLSKKTQLAVAPLMMVGFRFQRRRAIDRSCTLV